MAKKDSLYFKDFVSMIEISCRAAEHLQTSLKEFSPDQVQKRRSEIHEIENEADRLKHEMMERLVKEFIPPIDREDIVSLVHRLDDITDKIEDVFIHVYMFDVRKILPDALLMADVIVRCCQALKVAMVEFPNFHKSRVLSQKIIDVNTMEGEADLIYIEAIRKLYTTDGDPTEIYVWTKLFRLFEDCCDACEDAADELETVVLKNS